MRIPALSSVCNLPLHYKLLVLQPTPSHTIPASKLLLFQSFGTWVLCSATPVLILWCGRSELFFLSLFCLSSILSLSQIAGLLFLHVGSRTASLPSLRAVVVVNMKGAELRKDVHSVHLFLSPAWKTGTATDIFHIVYISLSYGIASSSLSHSSKSYIHSWTVVSLLLTPLPVHTLPFRIAECRVVPAG